MKLKILADSASLFFATPTLHLRGIHERSHPLYENAHRKKARHICQWVADNAGYKKSIIARFWGMDRAAIYYGCKMVDNRITTSPEDKKQLMEFMAFTKERIQNDPSKFSAS